MIDLANDELLSVGDVAEKLDVCQHTVRAWIHAGLLEAVRVGRRLKTTPRALNAFAKANTATVRPAPSEDELQQRAEAAKQRISEKYGWK